MEPDWASIEYDARHYEHWMGAYYTMYDLADGSSYTINTYGEGIDHVRHFIFDIVCDKNLKLTGDTQRRNVPLHKKQHPGVHARAQPFV